MARRKADWSELYPELLSSIAGKLETRDDFRHFRSVCKKWRSSIPQIPKHLAFLSPDFPHNFSQPLPHLSKFGPYSLKIVINSTFLIYPLQNPSPNPNVPPKPWLVTIEEPTPGKLFMRKPLTRDYVKLPENLNFVDLSKYNLSEVCRGYNFRGGNSDSLINYKVVLFYDPGSQRNSVDNCYALVLNGKGILVFVRLKNDDDHGCLRYSRVSCFDDIVNYKGAVWVADRKGRAYVVPYYSKHLGLVLYANDPVNLGYISDTRKRLVESEDGLYLIDRYHYEELIKFRVYKLDEAKHKSREIKSLDGRILFVASDCCFFGSVEDFPGVRGNCIVFPRGHFPSYYDSIYPDNFYFKGADKILEIGVFYLGDGESGLISNYPGFSKIFWPPPWWLFSDECPSDWEDMDDDKMDISEVCCSEEKSPASLVVENKAETVENPSAISGWEEFQGVPAPWSDLPWKLLTEIAKHLKTPIEITRFRAVCKKWRTSIPMSSNPFSSLLPRRITTSVAAFICPIRASTSFLSVVLVESGVYLLRPRTCSIGPPKSWLVTVEELHPGKFFLRKPLRRAAIQKLPDNFPKVLNLSDFHVSEISREYNFRFLDGQWELFSSSNWGSFSNSHKVVLFNTLALVLYDWGKLISFCLKREGGWQSVRYGSVTKFDDIININGKIYAIDRRGRAYVISCSSYTISRVANHALGSGIGPDRQKRLVESDGELYILLRDSPDDKIFFRVYKLNEDQHKWDEVKSLRDKILFVTPTFCFVAPAREFPGWKGNCIVFPEDCLPTNSGSTNPDARFFRRMIEELRIGVFYLGDEDGAKLIQSYPGYSDLFWPPPPWLHLAESSSRNERSHILPCKHSDTMEKAVERQSFDKSSAQQGKTAESETPPPITSPVQDPKPESPRAEFQGLKVKSELVPVLHKIWEKHGNITEQTTVTNPEVVSQALESLAEAVVILKTTPCRLSLSESQAGILRATLSDLQQICQGIGIGIGMPKESPSGG